MRKCTNGFTLIELVVVLLILSFSVAVVFPRFPSVSEPQSRLRSSVNKIANFAEYAHQRAASTRITHFLNIDTEEGMYWITSQKSDGQEIPITDGLSLRGRLPEGVGFVDVKLKGIKAISKDTTAIRLSPQGWADPATLILTCSTGQTMSIIIDEFSGQVETCNLEEMN